MAAIGTLKSNQSQIFHFVPTEDKQSWFFFHFSFPSPKKFLEGANFDSWLIICRYFHINPLDEVASKIWYPPGLGQKDFLKKFNIFYFWIPVAIIQRIFVKVY